MAKLTKGQIEGIRLLADLFVLEDITKQVMPKVFNAEQIEQFKQHMKVESPIPFEAGEELKRQIVEVRREWKARLESGDWS